MGAMHRGSFPVPMKFGIYADYFTQHEILLSQIKATYSYDCFVGCIRSVDSITYSQGLQSKEMLQDKYNAASLYRRHYEMMYALVASRLFDGVSGSGNIRYMQMKPEYSLRHTYNKLAMLPTLQHMYVEDDARDVLNMRGNSGRLSEALHEICVTKHIRIVPCNYAGRPEEMCYWSF